jgi:hypothetical protein
MAVPAAFLAMLQTAMPPNSVSLLHPDTALRFTERKLANATIFLLFNESATPIDNELILRSEGRKLEVWDAQSGMTTVQAAHAIKSGEVHTPVKLAPYATEVLVLH